MPTFEIAVAHRIKVQNTRIAMISIATEWMGTSYLMGGNSKQGVDCSHFVFEVLNEARRQVELPGPAPQAIDYRNTATIEASGSFVPIATPEIGDLILWDGHIGIVSNPAEGTFIGAQTRSGVQQASYVSGYWAARKGKRFVRFIHF